MLPLIGALVVGALVVLPTLLAQFSIGPLYKGIPFAFESDAEVYLSRIHEVSEGNVTLAQPYFSEYKNNPVILLPFGEYIYSAFDFILPGGAAEAVVVLKFVLPAALFLLVFAFMRQVLPQDNYTAWYAFATGLLVVLGYNLFMTAFYKTVMQVTPGLPFWSRPVNPITGALFLFGFLNVLTKALHARSWIWFVLAGVLWGFSVGYFFSFYLICLVFGFAFLLGLIKKEYGLLLKMLVSFGISLVIFGPLALNAGAVEQSLRNGLLLTHQPIFSKVLFIATVACALWVYWLYARYRKTGVFQWMQLVRVTIILVACWTALNTQILFGKTIWPGHFTQYTVPLAYICLVLIVAVVLQHVSSVYRIIFLTVIVSFSLIAGVHDVFAYKPHRNKFIEVQNYAPVLSWLKNNTEGACTVLVHEGSEKLTRSIPAYTNCDVYFSSYIFFNVPKERIWYNYYAYLRMQGVTPETLPEYLNSHSEELRVTFFRDYLDIFSLDKTGDPWLRRISDYPEIEDYFERVKTEIKAGYVEFLQTEFTSALAQYNLDYIIVDTAKGFSLPAELQAAVEKIETLNGYEIYKFTK